MCVCVCATVRYERERKENVQNLKRLEKNKLSSKDDKHGNNKQDLSQILKDLIYHVKPPLVNLQWLSFVCVWEFLFGFFFPSSSKEV